MFITPVKKTTLIASALLTGSGIVLSLTLTSLLFTAACSTLAVVLMLYGSLKKGI